MTEKNLPNRQEEQKDVKTEKAAETKEITDSTKLQLAQLLRETKKDIKKTHHPDTPSKKQEKPNVTTENPGTQRPQVVSVPRGNIGETPTGVEFNTNATETIHHQTISNTSVQPGPNIPGVDGTAPAVWSPISINTNSGY